MRPHRWLAAWTVAVLAALLIAGPVGAAPASTVFKDSGTGAFAGSFPLAVEDCTDNGDGTVTCESWSLDVFNGTSKQGGLPSHRGDRVCYSEATDTFNPETGEGAFDSVFGCAFDTGNVSTKKLTSVMLAPTTIQLFAQHCDYTATTFECTPETEAGSTEVQGTWTGGGPTFTFKSKSLFDDGVCFQRDSSKSQSRNAAFTGTADGTPLNPTQAQIFDGSSTFRTNCF